jgi:hypothetical protein
LRLFTEIATNADRQRNWRACADAAARAWLDADDQAAIEQAERIKTAEAYTSIPVKSTYH